MVPRHETSGKKEPKKSGDAARYFEQIHSQFKFRVGILQLEILNSRTVSCSIIQCFFLSFSLAWQSVKSMWRV